MTVSYTPNPAVAGSVDRVGLLLRRLRALRAFLGEVIYGTPEHEIVRPLGVEALAIEKELWNGDAANLPLLAWRMVEVADVLCDHQVNDQIPGRIARIIADLLKLSS